MIMRVVKPDEEVADVLLSPDEHAREILERILKEKPTGMVIIYETQKRVTKFKSSPDSAYTENGLIDAAFEIIHVETD